jgi:hypothetical protein
MSEAPQRILHLAVEGFSPEQVKEIVAPAEGSDAGVEIFQLTEASAPEALQKIFAADSVKVWGEI